MAYSVAGSFVPTGLACTLCFLLPWNLGAVLSGELFYPTPYYYGRFEARIRFGGGDGVISSFFLWKEGSEAYSNTWHEVDYEKVGLWNDSSCRLWTNVITGNPGPEFHDFIIDEDNGKELYDVCDRFFTYAFEWTPDALVWFVDGKEIRRTEGPIADYFREENVTYGMQMRFNIWPGRPSFGGNFSEDDLPGFQYIDWVRYYAYEDGDFKLSWSEDFEGDSLPAPWGVANWSSPFGNSMHDPGNVIFAYGCAILALTDDRFEITKETLPSPWIDPAVSGFDEMSMSGVGGEEAVFSPRGAAPVYP